MDDLSVNDSKLRDWLEIVGILAVVASLVFVGLEIRQSSRAAFEEAIVSDYGTMIAVEEVVVENADVWMRGTQGVNAADEDMTIDNMAWNLYRSEGLRCEWDTHGEWRPHVPDHVPFQRWRALVQARVLEYPVFEPEPIDNVFRCGLN